MIFSRRKKDNFILADTGCGELAGEYSNPGRGWYQIYTFLLSGESEKQLSALCFQGGETLALVLIDIGAYRKSALDQRALDFIDKIFQAFSNAGREMILRIVYDREGKGMENEPSFLSVVMGHMSQIGPVVKRYADSILVSQGLFVGSWGEMHSSKFLSPGQLRQLTETWRQEAGKSVRLAFRKPVQCRIVTAEGDKSDIGIFDDAMFASDSHMGTFGEKKRAGEDWNLPWCMSDELSFMEEISRNIPCGGEAVAGEREISPEETIKVLRDMRVSYLNSVYDGRILSRWKSQPYGESESLYQYIGNHLGYRFVVRAVELVERKGIFLRVLLENVGFANLCDETELRLIIRTGGEENVISLPYDIRELMPGETAEVTIDIKNQIKRGSRLDLGMIRCKDRRNISFANDEAGEQMFLGEIQ